MHKNSASFKERLPLAEIKKTTHNFVPPLILRPHFFLRPSLRNLFLKYIYIMQMTAILRYLLTTQSKQDNTRQISAKNLISQVSIGLSSVSVYDYFQIPII